MITEKEKLNIKNYRQLIEMGGETETIDFTCLITDVKEHSTKNDSIYLDIICSDSTGEVSIRKWNATMIDLETFKKGNIISLKKLGKNIWQGKFMGFLINPETNWNIETDEDPFNYKVSIIPDFSILESKLNSFISMVKEPSYKTVIDTLFSDEESVEKFMNGAGGETIHHNDRHGLLLHTVAMIESAMSLADVYNNLLNATLDKELIITAIICHDWYKTVEYTFDENWLASHNEYCILEGHIFRGAAFVQKLIDEGTMLNAERGKLLIHCILSHHGKLEWGSPVKPSTPEAFVIHTVDNMDARMYTFIYQSRLLNDGEISQKMFNLDGTQIYKPNFNE